MDNAEQPFPMFDNIVLGVVPEPERLDELHLYHGNRCNRACAFCCVSGAPHGAHMPFTPETLRAAVDMVATRGSLKIYGGEPTLDAANLRWTVVHLRALGFEGAITLFSNGLRPRVLVDLLKQDRGVFVVLNYAIAMGCGEEPIPARALSALKAYDATCPGRMFLSHDFVVEVGRQSGGGELPGPRPEEIATSSVFPAPARPGCYRCYPTLTSAGTFHACPFAVEVRHEHFQLGDVRTPPDVVRTRFRGFLQWIDETLETEAVRRGCNACAVCAGTNPPAFSPTSIPEGVSDEPIHADTAVRP